MSENCNLITTEPMKCSKNFNYITLNFGRRYNVSWQVDKSEKFAACYPLNSFELESEFILEREQS